MAVAAIHQGFFVSGGTVPLDALSYVERTADRQLFEALMAGRFCYVLNSRQMGKSSLCVRTKAKLESSGCRTAFVDLTKIGGRNVTPEQWYAGLALEIARSLDMREAILDYWKENAHLSPMQRMFGSLRDVVLEATDHRVVVFVDEIDSTRSLPFDTDEFFAGIRECYNRRVHDESYGRLSFCLLGVAVPSDLIRDARTTPFNIGERVYLRDFTADEVAAFSKGLPGREALVQRVFHWTGGHPFLTQSLCVAIAKAPSIASAGDVDRLIEREFLDPKARETNVNLADVGNRVLNMYADGDDVDQYRADILSAYSKARSGREALADDESNRVTAVLKLSGLMRSEGRTLKVRNRIYDRVFGKAWIKENMPGQELRRQRRAFMLGVVRTALAAGLILAVIGYLAISNYALARENEAKALEMARRAYVADMNRLPVLYDQNNVPAMKRLLTSHRDEEWRGIEWDYWNGIIHDALWETADYGQTSVPVLSPDEKEMITVEGKTARVLDAAKGKLLRTFQIPSDEPGSSAWLPNRRVIRSLSSGGGFIVDAVTGALQKTLPSDFTFESPMSRAITLDGKFGLAFRGPRQGVIDLQTYRFVRETSVFGTYFVAFLRDGKHTIFVDERQGSRRFDLIDIGTGAVKKTLVIREQVTVGDIDGRARFVTLGTRDGHVCRYGFDDGKLLWRLKVADAGIANLSASADGTLIGASTRNRASYLIRASDAEARLIRRFTDAQTTQIRRDGSLVYASYWITRAYRPDSLPPVVTIDLKENNQFGVLYHRATGRIMMGEPDRARLFELRDGRLVSVVDKRIEAPWEGWDMDSARPWIWRTDKRVSIIEDISTGRKLLELPGEPKNNVEFLGLPHDRLLLYDGRLQFDVVDLGTSKRSPAFKWFDPVRNLDLSGDESMVCIRSESGRVGVVDTSTWKVLWEKNLHRRPVLSGSFSRDNTLLVTTSHDDSAIVWDAKTGRKITQLIGHAQSVTGADFTPDSTRVVTVGDDRTLRIWETQTGIELTTMGDTGDFPELGTVTNDGRHVLTRNGRGQLKIWPLAYKSSGAKS